MGAASSPEAENQPRVRIRITKSLSGSIDGIRLDAFVVDGVYNVSTLLGCYLLADDAAEPIDGDTSNRDVTPRQLVCLNNTWSRPPVAPVPQPVEVIRAVAADREPRRRKPGSDRVGNPRGLRVRL